MLEQIREAEMVQAIDRVRPIFNHRKVFVLNNLPLDLTVDRAMTWPELRPGNFVRPSLGSACCRSAGGPNPLFSRPLDQKTANKPCTAR